ncbi:hypothetical protein GN956_G5630 [Arapaima gigas]
MATTSDLFPEERRNGRASAEIQQGFRGREEGVFFCTSQKQRPCRRLRFLRTWTIMSALLLLLLLPLGQALIQSPDLLVDRGLNVTLSCFQNQTDFNTMSWFQQRPGQALKLVVHYYIQMGGEEKEFTGRFSATRRGPSLDLTVHYLQITDSAVYFCAKQQAQWCASTWGQDKNISPLPT